MLCALPQYKFQAKELIEFCENLLKFVEFLIKNQREALEQEEAEEEKKKTEKPKEIKITAKKKVITVRKRGSTASRNLLPPPSPLAKVRSSALPIRRARSATLTRDGGQHTR